jgi:putative PIN family toxin of toxin-antitoxin system
MRVVLDSSVLIAAYISRAGVCAELLEEILMHDDLVLSAAIIDEVTEKLRTKFLFSQRDVADVRRSLERSAELVEPITVPRDVCRDQEDLVVLGTAGAARARLLITVDHDLLVLEHYAGADIVKPGGYWQLKRRR